MSEPARGKSGLEKLRNAKAKDGRKGVEKTPVEQVAMGSYVPGIPDVSADIAVEWGDNQGLRLPLDSRIFPPSAIALMRAGKFERGLARKLPQALPKSCTVLEIGSAVGFRRCSLRAKDPICAWFCKRTTPLCAGR